VLSSKIGPPYPLVLSLSKDDTPTFTVTTPPNTVRAELVEALFFLPHLPKTKQPFDKLRANGGRGRQIGCGVSSKILPPLPFVLSLSKDVSIALSFGPVLPERRDPFPITGNQRRLLGF
jgi:hypothetical protein